MSSRYHKASPGYGLAKLKSEKPLNARSKNQPDIMTFADLVKSVTEKLMYLSRKPNRQCTWLNGKPNPKIAKHATSAMLTSGMSANIISDQDQKICQTAVEIIERNKATLVQKSTSSSPKKNYFCFASEYLAELEEVKAVEKKDRSPSVDIKTQKMAHRIADLHRSLGTRLSVVAEEEESDESTKPRFKIPSRVKIPQQASSQSDNLKQKHNAFIHQKMPGQSMRRRWYPKLEGIAESVEVMC